MTVAFDELAAWTGCSACSGSATAGARALMAYWLEVSAPTGTNLGIYACRPIAGSSALSIHACGRAVDLGVPVVPGGHPAAWALLRRVADSGRARALGFQGFIWARTAWYATEPAGRPYQGVHPHWDHIHAELTPAAGASLTLATLRAVLGTEPLEGAPPVTDHQHTPDPSDLPRGIFDGSWDRFVAAGAPPIQPGSRGHTVYREDLAWHFDRYLMPMLRRIAELEGRIAELEAGGVGDGVTIPEGDARWARRGSTVTLP